MRKHIHSIKSIHITLQSSINLLEAYTEFKGLKKIINSCRLVPIDAKIQLVSKIYRKWKDEFGNSLNVDKSKKINIKYGDLSINKKFISCSDLYYGLSISNMIKISKLLYITYGQDEEYLQDCIILSLLGIDNYLRTYLYMYGEWQQISSLHLGLTNLKSILRNNDIKRYLELKNKEKQMPCKNMKSYLSHLPMTDEFKEILNKQCNIVYKLIGENL